MPFEADVGAQPFAQRLCLCGVLAHGFVEPVAALQQAIQLLIAGAKGVVLPDFTLQHQLFDAGLHCLMTLGKGFAVWGVV